MSADNFPVDTFKEAAAHLRRPFAVPAIRFRVLQGKNGRANCAAYIDARLVAERLNLVIPHAWSDAYEPVQGGMRCDLTVDGLTRSDVGWSKGTAVDMDLKALYSDAFKRAGVKFGIGVSLYALPSLVLTTEKQQVREWQKPGAKQPTYFMQPKGETDLRTIYKRWLDGEGGKAFGKPLDHGDVEREPEGELPAEPPANIETIDDARAAVIGQKISDALAGDRLTQDGLSLIFSAAGAGNGKVTTGKVAKLTTAQADEVEGDLLKIVGAPA